MVSGSWELEGGGGHGTGLVQPFSFAYLFPGLIYSRVRETIELRSGLSWCSFSWVLNSFWVAFLGRVMPWCVVTHRLRGSVHGGWQSHVERSTWRVGRGVTVSGWCQNRNDGHSCWPRFWPFLLWFYWHFLQWSVSQGIFSFTSKGNINQLLSKAWHRTAT